MKGQGMSQKLRFQGRTYDPRLCKTCQELGVPNPKVARTEYSDCDEHYLKRLNKMGLSIEIMPVKKKKSLRI
jgi:hypothetical protein